MKRILAGEMPLRRRFSSIRCGRRTPPKWKRSESGSLRECPPAPKESVVAEGAPDPLVKDEARKFWSFQSPQRPAVPQVSNQDRVRNPIDAFLLQKLETKGLELFRRGRPGQADAPGLHRFDRDAAFSRRDRAYLADTRPDAYERLIDSLLASPHYGERWGLYWLNAAGYSDSEGISTKTWSARTPGATGITSSGPSTRTSHTIGS